MIFKKLFEGNVLYYPGCMSKFVLSDIQKNYEEILRKCGIDFIKLKDLEVCCGSPVLNAGYSKDFEILAEKNLKVFKEHGVRKIITSCPACFKTFKKKYPEVLEKFDIEVEHVTQSIWKAIETGKLKVKKINKKVTYHDPCHLGRGSGIYEEPRNILKTLGFEIIEMKFNRENAWCCGGGGGLRPNYPELSEEISRDRIKQAEETEAESLITCCPMCYCCLKEINGKSKIDVKELSSAINEII